MNIGTRLLISAALAVGSTVGAAALGTTLQRDGAAGLAAESSAVQSAAELDEDSPTARADGVRAELLAAAAAGDISWEAAHRVSDDLGSYILGERDAAAIAV
ncbi:MULTISPECIES: hypothetical protein [Brevibacterium]|jgi:hypothetical protein|uniref:DUF4148 domain-containing protein n=1 Tax=Brevibacterium salitolerans TaxID=1403566 RepID=A0ABP5IQA8_9MICO|nr:hypothetical protein [Brevibacterium sp.]